MSGTILPTGAATSFAPTARPATMRADERLRARLAPSARSASGPVLLACDGRGSSDAAAIAARRIAARLGESVEVVAVLQPYPVYAAGIDGIAPLPPDFESHRRDALHATVRARLEPVLGSRERWPLDVRYGSPGRVIAGTARERHAGLIVVGTGRHRSLDRVLGENVPLQVVRRARTPVLAVAPGLAAPIRRVVVGMDFSAASIRAARTALELIDPGPSGSALVALVHVRAAAGDESPLHSSGTGTYDLGVSELFARLRELLRPSVPAGLTLETRVRSGAVVDCLREAAAELEADVIAVGTHGPDWVERLLLGSVATSTLRHARTSVLVAPPPDAAERMRLKLAVAGRIVLERPEDWAVVLDAFTQRHAGRRVLLEVSRPGLEDFVVEAEDLRFRGATCDAHDRRVAIVLGSDVEPTRDVTHAVSSAVSIEIAAADERASERLLVTDARRELLLTFLD